MKSIEIAAKTVESAVETALKELQVSREDVEVEVLEEPSKGLFGLIGSRMAKVRVTVKKTAEDLAVEFLTNVFRNMGLSVNMNCKTDNGYINISIKGTRLGILIGRRGETLDALQYLTNLAVNRKTEKRVNIILDVEGYRKRREETLNRLARRLAEKVKRTGNKVMLEPMNPHERRIIHTALQNNMDVTTYSEGEEPYRKVIIALKNAH
ncbi:MAG: RNA-binding cell elongation regulator Jag/EloR [Zhaonellaceae bacterium]|jgi:spoIIIJ-associated protein|nr:protein jag [Clostridia bacterium]